MRIFRAAALAMILIMVPVASASAVIERMAPDVAYDGINDRFFVVYNQTPYDDMGTPLGPTRVTGVVLDGNGVPLGPEFPISDTAAVVMSASIPPAVAFSPDSQWYLVAWGDLRDSMNLTDIYAQMVTADGVCVTRSTAAPGFDNFTLSAMPEDQLNPDLAYSTTSQRFLCVWNSYDAVFSQHDIMGQLADAFGFPYSTDVTVNLPVCIEPIANQTEPSVAWDSGNDRFVVVWMDQRDYETSYTNIYGQMLNAADGTPYSTATDINFPVSTASGDQNYPELAYVAGTLLAAWEDLRTGTVEIRGQVFSAADGTPVSSTVSTNDVIYPGDGSISAMYAPRPVADAGLGHFATVWGGDFRGDPTSMYGQLTGPDAAPLTTTVDINHPIYAPVPGYRPVGAYGNGRYLIAYQYYGGMYDDVYWAVEDGGFPFFNPDNYLSAWWPMDEGTGSTLADASPVYTNTVSLSGSCSWVQDRNSSPGQAVDFTGGGSGQAAASNSLDAKNGLTVCAWFKPGDTISPEQTIVAKNEAGNLSWELVQEYDGITFRVSHDGLVWDAAEATATGVLYDNVWTHVAAVVAGDYIVLYVNAQMMGMVFMASGGNIYQGSSAVTFGTPSTLNGTLDDVRIYRTALPMWDISKIAGYTGLLTGRITDLSTGLPVANAEISLWNEEMDQSFWTMADVEGYYTVYTLPGCNDVRAQGPSGSSYAVSPAVMINVLDEKDGGTVKNFALDPVSYNIYGTVYDSGGAPQPNANLNFDAWDFGIYAWAQSDASGQYTITGIPANTTGRLQAGVGATLATAAQQVAVGTSDVASVDFYLPAESTISGQVVDPSGAGVPFAFVGFYCEGADSFSGTMADASGNFTLTGVPPGLGWLMAEPPNGSSAYAETTEVGVYVPAAGSTINVDPLVMPFGTVVSGNVVKWNAGDLPCGLEVNSDGPVYCAENMVKNGTWSLNLPAGTHRIYLEGEGFDGATVPAAALPITVTVSPTDVQMGNPVIAADDIVVYEAGEGGSANVTAVDPGGWTPPATGHLIAIAFPAGFLQVAGGLDQLQSVFGMEPVRVVPVDAVGVAEYMEALPPGTYDFALGWEIGGGDGPGDVTIMNAVTGVTISDGVTANVSIDLPASWVTLSGKVTDSAANPLPGTGVFVMRADGVALGQTLTDGSGNYTMSAVPASAAGMAYSVTSRHVLLEGSPEEGFTAVTGSDVTLPDIVLLNSAYAAPAFVSTPVTSATEGVQYSYQAQALGQWGVTYGFDAASSHPAAMSIDAYSGVISYLPAAGDAGDYSVSVLATDAYGRSATQTYNLAVAAPAAGNTPPTTPVPASGSNTHSATPESMFSVEMLSTDAETSILTWTVSGPTGMVVTSVTSGSAWVDWTPTAAQADQSFTFTVTASDGTYTATSAVQTVNVGAVPNTPPTKPVEMSGQTSFDAMGARPLKLEFISTDAETTSTALNWTVSGPAGMQVTETGVGYAIVEWTPAPAQWNGTFTFTVTASDGANAATSDSMSVTVYAPLAVTPPTATPLIIDAVSHPVDCNITGGLPPYSVSVSDAAVGGVTGLDASGMTTGSFGFDPIAAGTCYINITDAAGFTLAAGPFVPVEVSTSYLTGITSLSTGTAYSINVTSAMSTALDGLVMLVPSTAVTSTLAGQALDINECTFFPPLVEEESGFAQFTPEGASFNADLTVTYPYKGTRDINKVLAFVYNAEKGRWVNMPVISRDPVNKTVTFSTDHFSVYTVAAPTSYTLSVAGGTTSTDYRMVSLPAYPADRENPAELFAESLGPYYDSVWRLFGFDASAQSSGDPNVFYKEATASTFATEFGIEPGRAWWIISKNSSSIPVRYLSTDSTADYFVRVEPGWNAIGNPYDTQVDFTLMEATVDGSIYYNWGFATPGNPLTNPDTGMGESLYLFDPANPSADARGYVATTLMDPYKGYWFYNNSDKPAVLCFQAWMTGGGPVALAKPAQEGGMLASLPLVKKAWAVDDLLRTPPPPPGATGDNPGSVEAIGVVEDSASCFVHSAKRSPMGLWAGLGLLALAALAAWRIWMR
ncbi:MAG: hypothetical protein JRI97_01010 [Deltaproteobacteria bacterium]|nr:hypothetical protein [Deltaproteobacteria bacterium]